MEDVPSNATPKESQDKGSDDDFLAKLNEMRRRSLVMSKDVRENQIGRKPSQIKEETEDESNTIFRNERDVTSVITKPSSRPSTSGSVAHTFRISPDKETRGKGAGQMEILRKRSQSMERVSLKPSKQPLTSSLLTNGKGTHDKWLKRKIEEEREKRRKKKEMEEAKIKIENEKREQSKKLFERWKADRDEKERILMRERRAKEKAKLTIEEDKRKNKQMESEKNFNIWVRKRSESISTRVQKSKEVGEKRKEQTDKERKEKLSEAQKAFEAWKIQKLNIENKIKKEIEEKKSIEMEKRKAEKEYKELLAQQAYTTWLELKTPFLGSPTTCDIRTSDTTTTCNITEKHSKHEVKSIARFQDNYRQNKENIRSHIIGGNNAYLGSWPWQALIKYQDYTNGKSFFCGGTLISSSYVLTAAHCTVTMNISGGTTVFLGTVDSSKHEIKSSVVEKVVHPDYSANRYLNPSELNDIAILRLAISVKYTDFIQPICLPVKNYTIPTAYAYVIGFGSTNSKPLFFKDYREKWEELEDYGGGFTIDDSQICAGALGHGSAQGDSGGPLLVQGENGLWYQIGITSFGVNYGKGYYDQGLAPGIYTRITSFCDFITKATHSEFCLQEAHSLVLRLYGRPHVVAMEEQCLNHAVQ
uniref:Peptidase S1 domain-containing protein n=1 Tax=Heterorhabditis bacteriophora TaxID=37862 RepID=A0A1I7XTW3_HETBA